MNDENNYQLESELIEDIYKCGETVTIKLPPNILLDHISVQLKIKVDIQFQSPFLADILQESHLPYLPNELVDKIVGYTIQCDKIHPINYLLIDNASIEMEGVLINKVDEHWMNVHRELTKKPEQEQMYVVLSTVLDKKETCIYASLASLSIPSHTYFDQETVLKIGWKAEKECKKRLIDLVEYEDPFDLFIVNPHFRIYESALYLNKVYNLKKRNLILHKISSHTRKVVRKDRARVEIPLNEVNLKNVYISLDNKYMQITTVETYIDTVNFKGARFRGSCTSTPMVDKIHHISFPNFPHEKLYVNKGTLCLFVYFAEEFTGKVYIHLISELKID